LTLGTGPDGKCTLSVEDSGVGIPGDLDVNTSKSLGLRLVRLLTQQIRARSSWSSPIPERQHICSSRWTTMHADFISSEPRGSDRGGRDSDCRRIERAPVTPWLFGNRRGGLGGRSHCHCYQGATGPGSDGHTLEGEKDGVQAASEIRQQVDLPIIYLTAYSDWVTVHRAKATERDSFILKPFHRRELQSTIEVAMQRHAIRTRRNKQ